MAATPRGVQLKLKEHSYRESLLVWREDKRAAIPRRRGSECIGYDLCTVDECTLIPGVMSFVSTGLVMRVPDGHYGRLASHPESLELGIDVLNGVVEPDSRAVVRVVGARGSPVERARGRLLRRVARRASRGVARRAGRSIDRWRSRARASRRRRRTSLGHRARASRRGKADVDARAGVAIEGYNTDRSVDRSRRLRSPSRRSISTGWRARGDGCDGGYDRDCCRREGASIGSRRVR